ncbi:MAG TPA: hypothetical protein DIW47_00585 [Bacteroidetes bacterium]|nr:hypothetical protein [Bacteroidota bacterium]
MKTLFTLLFVLGSFALANAQDKIFLSSGKIIECKVTEVGTEEIKYKVSTEVDAAVYTIKKIDVIRIEFANGHVEKFKEELSDPDIYLNNKKNAWKFDFMSPVWGSSIFGYERSIRPALSMEVNMGIIGMGYDMYNVKPRGALVKVGPKFMLTPDFRSRSMRFSHLFKGLYIQPQLIAGVYGADVNYFEYTSTGFVGVHKARETTSYGNVMLNFGQQAVFTGSFLIDVYAGVGYSYTNTTTKNKPANTGSNEFYNGYTPTFGVLNPDFYHPISFTAGIKFGFLTR